jgi:hypothetical protein
VSVVDVGVADDHASYDRCNHDVNGVFEKEKGKSSALRAASSIPVQLGSNRPKSDQGISVVKAYFGLGSTNGNSLKNRSAGRARRAVC